MWYTPPLEKFLDKRLKLTPMILIMRYTTVNVPPIFAQLFVGQTNNTSVALYVLSITPGLNDLQALASSLSIM